MATKRWCAGVAAFAAALLAVGCSGTAVEDTAGSASSSEGTESAALAAELNKGPATGSQLEDRDIVYTGAVTVRVGDVEDAATEAAKVATDAGGYLSGQESNLEGDRTISLTLRVPALEFDDAMAAVAELGTVQARSVESDEVTDTVVDLEGRLENARASAARLRELVAEAQNLENIVALEQQLSDREQEIEQIAGQVEVLADDVAFATLTANLNEKDEPTVSDDLPGPLESLRAGAVAVANGLIILVSVLAFLLPFTPFVALGWFGWRAWRRRHPKAEPTLFTPPQPFGAPAPPPPPQPGPEPAPEPEADGPEDPSS